MSCLWDRTKNCGNLRYIWFDNVIFARTVVPIVGPLVLYYYIGTSMPWRLDSPLFRRPPRYTRLRYVRLRTSLSSVSRPAASATPPSSTSTLVESGWNSFGWNMHNKMSPRQNKSSTIVQGNYGNRLKWYWKRNTWWEECHMRAYKKIRKGLPRWKYVCRPKWDMTKAGPKEDNITNRASWIL